MTDPHSTIPQSASAVIIAELHCRSCGYNLKTLATDRACPECGLPVWQSLQHAVDPASSRLPQIRNPRQVGRGLVWLATMMLLAVVAYASPVIAGAIDQFDSSNVRNLSRWTPRQMQLVAALLVLLLLPGVRMIGPRKGIDPGEGAVRKDIYLLAVGALLIASSMVVEYLVRNFSPGGAVAARISLGTFVIMYLIGLRGVLRVVGLRSRVYRNAANGRQSIRAIMGAVFVAAFGDLVGASHLIVPFMVKYQEAGPVISYAGLLMLVIGLAYFLVNVTWISRSLRKPPPPIELVVGTSPG